jgi:single-strand DNA-binding protein
MNKIVVLGRITKDPELKFVQSNGKVYAKVTLAVERPFKNEKGERETDFIPVIFWGRKAEIVCQYMTKGRQLSVGGRLQTRFYDDNDGKKRFAAEVVASDFQFVDKKAAEEVIEGC